MHTAKQKMTHSVCRQCGHKYVFLGWEETNLKMYIYVIGRQRVDKITSTFPTVSFEQALDAIKVDMSADDSVQQIKVPKQVGGEVEILIGHS